MEFILVCEGKRLPAPSSDREMEYVTGGNRKNGGIQRFKLGLHGAALNVAAMIGYLQARSTHDWHRLINSWIANLACGTPPDVCAWKTGEALGPLQENESGKVANCVSVHDRAGNAATNTIELHHLWIVMGAGEIPK
jgi:hypothetical protein